MKRLCVFLFILIILLPLVALAHPGRTDEDGGHIDNAIGEYHYHHGYPAHQHENGVCPYDFDDRTGENSGTSSSRSTSTSRNTSQDNEELNELKKENRLLKNTADRRATAFNVLAVIFAMSIATIVILIIVTVKRKQRILKLTDQMKAQKSSFEAECGIIREKYQEEKAKYDELVLEVLENDNIDKNADALEAIIEQRKEKVERITAAVKALECSWKSSIPKDTEIGSDGLPRVKGAAENWGDKYTVYVSGNKGSSYHKKECKLGYYPMHIFLAVKKYKPCNICKPETPPYDWYTDYLKCEKMKALYKFTDAQANTEM